MPGCRDAPLSLGDRPLSPRRETFRHSCLYFPNAADAAGAAGHGACSGRRTRCAGASKPDDDK